MKPGRLVARVRRRVRRRWQRRRVWRAISVLGCVACGLFLLLVWAIRAEWLTDAQQAEWFWNRLVAGTLLMLLAVIGYLRLRRPSRPFVDGLIESAEPRLLDRLHALRFLDTTAPPAGASFRPRIESGAEKILRGRRERLHLPSSGAAVSVVALATLLGGTLYYYHRHQPWQLLQPRFDTDPLPVEAEPAEPALPDEVEESQPAWGEVRITAPGRDLQVTRADTVYLQIEAAADRPLEAVAWLDAVNGAAETEHSLPEPREPRFAVYEPVLYLDQLGLSDWDVVTYYARAEAGGDRYSSEVYFLEVRPFREEQEEAFNLSGGSGSPAPQLLGLLTHLISRQQEIVRATHRHAQDRRLSEATRSEQRERLAAAELALRDAALHLAARLAEGLAEAPIASVLEHLGQAEAWLGKAATSLRAANLGEAQERERSALRELSETRKDLYRAAAAPASQADRRSERDRDDEDPLTAIAELRDSAAAAQAFAGEALSRQKAITTESLRALPDAALAAKQERLARDLESSAANHARATGDLPEAAEARRVLQEAEKTMREHPEMGVTVARNAQRSLAELGRKLTETLPHRLLSDAYALRRMLGDEATRLEELARRPQTASEETARLAERARRIVGELKKLIATEPVGEAFGPALKEALDDTTALDAAATALSSTAADRSSQARNASSLAEELRSLGRAFDASAPSVLREVDPSRALEADDKKPLARGMEQIDNLLWRAEGGQPLSPENGLALRTEALQNLERGLQRGDGGHSDRTSALFLLIGGIRAEPQLRLESLRKLQEALRQFVVEMDDPTPDTARDPQLTSIDPELLPTAYRQPIEAYFKKLSEDAGRRAETDD